MNKPAVLVIGRRVITRVLSFGLFFFICAAGSGASDSSQLRPWTNYQAIMWIGDTAYRNPDKVSLFYQRLREMGITTGMVHGDSNIKPLLQNNFPYYVENMVTRGLCLKFQSKVTDWDKFVTEWNRSGRREEAFVRDYSFDDPKWQQASRRQMQDLVRKNMTNAPVAYDIRDELSVTYSANPFDYDFSPSSLEGFRTWLKGEYRDVAALNAQWDTDFTSWADVKPFSTDRIKIRMTTGDRMPRGKIDSGTLQNLRFDPVAARKQPARWNLSPWCDFRTYMDSVLARTLGDLRATARELDPRTPVGIEGTQMPSAWGGYDLWRLSQVLDWVEPYDIGNAREIFGSFMAGKPLMTTVFEKDTQHASRRLWHLLLEGDRGCIIWWSEDCIDWKSPDYALTAKAKALAPVLKEMTSPLAHIFMRAQRERDPVYLVYSHPSVQVDWLVESTRDGASWHRRFSSFEASNNLMSRRRNAWLKLLQDLGYTPEFVPVQWLQTTAPTQKGPAVLVLSDAFAMSSADAEGAAKFITGAGGPTKTLFCDAALASFDEHGKLRTIDSPAARFTRRTATVSGAVKEETTGAAGNGSGETRDISSFSHIRLSSGTADWYSWAQRQIAVPRPVVVPAETHTRTHRYKLGSARLLAFERNIDYHMSEDLKQADGNEPLEKPAQIEATLAEGGHVYDVRTGRYVGNTTRISFMLDPWQPSLFAVLPEKLDSKPLLDHLGALASAQR